jgi:hypothetical protein
MCVGRQGGGRREMSARLAITVEPKGRGESEKSSRKGSENFSEQKS